MTIEETLEMLRAMAIRHGSGTDIVLGVEIDGEMSVGHIESIGTVTNEEGQVAVCMATKPMTVDAQVGSIENHIHSAARKSTGDLHGMPWVLCHCSCGATKFDTDLNWAEKEEE